jgi:ABC-2 type transport system permease protein
MTLFFTATAVSPAIFPLEGQAKTLEWLASCPITIEAIVNGDMIASLLFGIGITFVTVIIGLALGPSLLRGILLLAAILLAAVCFSAIGMLLAVPPTNVPSNVMMLSSLIKFPLVFISILHPAGANAVVGTGANGVLTAYLLH